MNPVTQTCYDNWGGPHYVPKQKELVLSRLVISGSLSRTFEKLLEIFRKPSRIAFGTFRKGLKAFRVLERFLEFPQKTCLENVSHVSLFAFDLPSFATTGVSRQETT
jgi:hypothetical protein